MASCLTGLGLELLGSLQCESDTLVNGFEEVSIVSHEKCSCRGQHVKCRYLGS